jgi:hypothetical protein
MRLVWNVAYKGEKKRNARTFLSKSPQKQRPFRRYMYIWEDSTENILHETGSKDLDFIYLDQENVQWQAPIGTGHLCTLRGVESFN